MPRATRMTREERREILREASTERNIEATQPLSANYEAVIDEALTRPLPPSFAQAVEHGQRDLLLTQLETAADAYMDDPDESSHAEYMEALDDARRFNGTMEDDGGQMTMSIATIMTSVEDAEAEMSLSDAERNGTMMYRPAARPTTLQPRILLSGLTPVYAAQSPAVGTWALAALERAADNVLENPSADNNAQYDELLTFANQSATSTNNSTLARQVASIARRVTEANQQRPSERHANEAASEVASHLADRGLFLNVWERFALEQDANLAAARRDGIEAFIMEREVPSHWTGDPSLSRAQSDEIDSFLGHFNAVYRHSTGQGLTTPILRDLVPKIYEHVKTPRRNAEAFSRQMRDEYLFSTRTEPIEIPAAPAPSTDAHPLSEYVRFAMEFINTNFGRAALPFGYNQMVERYATELYGTTNLWDFASKAAEMVALRPEHTPPPESEQALTPTQLLNLNELMRNEAWEVMNSSDFQQATPEVRANIYTAARRHITEPRETASNNRAFRVWVRMYLTSLGTDAPPPLSVAETTTSRPSLYAYAEQMFRKASLPFDPELVKDAVNGTASRNQGLDDFYGDVKYNIEQLDRQRQQRLREERRLIGLEHLVSLGYDPEYEYNKNVLVNLSSNFSRPLDEFKKDILLNARSPARERLAYVGQHALADATRATYLSTEETNLVLLVTHEAIRNGWDDQTLINAVLQANGVEASLTPELVYRLDDYERIAYGAAKEHLGVSTTKAVKAKHEIVEEDFDDIISAANERRDSKGQVEALVRHYFDTLPEQIRAFDIKELVKFGDSYANMEFGPRLKIPSELRDRIARMAEEAIDAGVGDAKSRFKGDLQPIVQDARKEALEVFLRDKTRLPPHPDAKERQVAIAKDARSLKNDTAARLEGNRLNAEIGNMIQPCTIRNMVSKAQSAVRSSKHNSNAKVSPSELRDEMWKLLETQEQNGELPLKDGVPAFEQYFGGGVPITGGAEALAETMCGKFEGQNKEECTRTYTTLKEKLSPWLYCDDEKDVQVALDDRYGKNAKMAENPLRKLNGRKIEVDIMPPQHEMGSEAWWERYNSLKAVKKHLMRFAETAFDKIVEDGANADVNTPVSFKFPFKESDDPSHVGVIYLKDLLDWMNVEGKTPEQYGGEETYELARWQKERYDSGGRDQRMRVLSSLLGAADPEYGGMGTFQNYARNRKTVVSQKGERKSSPYEDARLSVILEKTKSNEEVKESIKALPTNKPEKLTLVISTEPADILHKSTDQQWLSCEAYEGSWPKGPPDDVRYHNAVVWLRQRGENKNIGRIMLRGCKDEDGKDNIGMEPRIYPFDRDGTDGPKMKILKDALLAELKKEGLGEFLYCKTPYIYNGYIDTHNNINATRHSPPSAQGGVPIYYGDYDAAKDAERGISKSKSSVRHQEALAEIFEGEAENGHHQLVPPVEMTTEQRVAEVAPELAWMEELTPETAEFWVHDEERLTIALMQPGLAGVVRGGRRNGGDIWRNVRNSDRIINSTVTALSDAVRHARTADPLAYQEFAMDVLNHIDEDGLPPHENTALMAITHFIAYPKWGASKNFIFQEDDPDDFEAIEKWGESIGWGMLELGNRSGERRFVLLETDSPGGLYDERRVYLLPLELPQIQEGLRHVAEYNYDAPKNLDAARAVNANEADALVEAFLKSENRSPVRMADTSFSATGYYDSHDENNIFGFVEIAAPAELNHYADKEFAAICRQFMVPAQDDTVNAVSLFIAESRNYANRGVELYQPGMRLDDFEFLSGSAQFTPMGQYIVERCNRLGFVRKGMKADGTEASPQEIEQWHDRQSAVITETKERFHLQTYY